MLEGLKVEVVGEVDLDGYPVAAVVVDLWVFGVSSWSVSLGRLAQS